MKGLCLHTLIFGLFVLVVICIDNGADAYANETALRAMLKSGYDMYAYPSRPVDIDVNYNLRFMSDLDITAQSMSHLGWFEFYWNDSRLTWDPATYGNITILNIDWAWIPTYSINGIDAIKQIGFDGLIVMVYYQGLVKFQQKNVLNTPCEVHVTRFPYDEQTCDIDVVFGEHDYGQTVLLNSEPEMRTHSYIKNNEWDFISSSMTVISATFPGTFVQYIGRIRMQVSFKRLKEFYVINLLVPAILLSIAMLWAFIIPTECGERLGFSLTILLSYTVLLTIIADLLPSTSQEVPYIATYLLVVLILCTIIVCNVGLNVKLYFLEDTPSKCLQIVYKKVRPVVFLEFGSLKRNRVKNVPVVKDIVIEDYDATKKKLDGNDVCTGEQENVISKSNSDVNITYKDVSILLDRICFYVYSMCVFGCTLWVYIVLNG